MMQGTFRPETVMGRELFVYTPVSYEAGDRRFPVVYVQDGGEMVKQGLNALEHLVMTKRLPELIFVGIKPRDRNGEYTPWPAKALAPDRPDFGGGAADYLRELVGTIKPFVDGRYRTLPGRESTGIAGGSLGGLVSLYAYYLYPEVFGNFALLSASFWYEGFLEYMERQPASESSGHRIYMYVGALEGMYKTNVQKEMVSRTKRAHRLLLDQGFTEDRLKFEIGESGTHDGMLFALRFPSALQWLFGERSDSVGTKA